MNRFPVLTKRSVCRFNSAIQYYSTIRLQTLQSGWRRMSAAKADKERLSDEWKARRALL